MRPKKKGRARPKKSAEQDAEHDVEVKKTEVAATQAQKKSSSPRLRRRKKTYAQVLAERQAKARSHPHRLV